MVRPRSCRVIYYFDTPALGRRHQSFGRVKELETFKEHEGQPLIHLVQVQEEPNSCGTKG